MNSGKAFTQVLPYNSMTTARIGPDDESLLRDFLFHAIFIPDGEQPLDRNVLDLPEISKYVMHWGRDGDVGLKLLHEGRAIGAIWCRLYPAVDPGFGFVREDIPELATAVLPEYRSRGLGLMLYREFEELLILQQLRGLSLSVDKRNPAARFYRRVGFKVIREDETAFTMMLLDLDSFRNSAF